MAAENIADYFTGPGAVTATVGAESVQVYLDRPDEEFMGGRVESTEYLMTYPHTAFAAMTEGAAVAVDGGAAFAQVTGAYTVREDPKAQDDGKIMRVLLSKN